MHTLMPHSKPNNSHAHLSQALLTVCADVMLKPTATSAVQQLCDELVEQVPDLKLVWTWFGKPDTHFIRPQTVSGAASVYGHTLIIDTLQLTAVSPTFNALHGQAGKPYEVTEHSVYANWRESALSHGVRSVLAVPLAAENAAEVGVMVLYASEQDYFDRMGTGLFEALGYFTGAILKKQRREEALENMAYYDSLTGQLNRNGLYLALHAQPQAGYCVMLDIDSFKVVNDTYGHTVGDVVLSHLGTLIDRHTLKRRQLDSNKHLEFYAARWGGEEFFIFLGNATEAQAADWVDHLRLAVEQMEYPLTKEHNIKITASFGVAFCPDSHALLHTTIEKADLALYQAKASGRNRVEMYSAALSKRVSNKSSAKPAL